MIQTFAVKELWFLSDDISVFVLFRKISCTMVWNQILKLCCVFFYQLEAFLVCRSGFPHNHRVIFLIMLVCVHKLVVENDCIGICRFVWYQLIIRSGAIIFGNGHCLWVVGHARMGRNARVGLSRFWGLVCSRSQKLLLFLGIVHDKPLSFVVSMDLVGGNVLVVVCDNAACCVWVIKPNSAAGSIIIWVLEFGICSMTFLCWWQIIDLQLVALFGDILMAFYQFGEFSRGV